MAEYIDKKEALAILRNFWHVKHNGTLIYSAEIDQAITEVRDLQPADVAPVRHGRWNHLRAGDWTSTYECSVCARRVVVAGDKDKADVYKMQELCKAVNAVANAAPTITLDDLRPSGRWIDAKAQHPPLDKMVLVIVNGKPKNNITLDRAYELAEWEPEGWCLEMWPEWMETEVSHWMYLPEPPKEG